MLFDLGIGLLLGFVVLFVVMFVCWLLFIVILLGYLRLLVGYVVWFGYFGFVVVGSQCLW